MVPYRIEGIDTPIYAKRYVIQAPYFAESSVEIIAECSKNEKATGNNDCYFLDLFLSVDDYGTREPIVGLYFGSHNMNQEEIDTEVRAYILSQLDDTFHLLVRKYLLKEQLIEDWLNEHGDEMG